MPHKMRMREKAILRIVVKRTIPFVLLFALYVQFHGDFGPGGGFQAGVLFAMGLILFGLVFGTGALREVAPPRALEFAAASGVLLYAGVGVATLLLGQEFLSYNALDPADPVHGQHLGILLVELGVGVTVAAVMLMMFYGFAGRAES